MPDTTMTDADLAFYKWVNANSSEYGVHSMNYLKRIFMAGWAAAMEAGQPDA